MLIVPSASDEHEVAPIRSSSRGRETTGAIELSLCSDMKLMVPAERPIGKACDTSHMHLPRVRDRCDRAAYIFLVGVADSPFGNGPLNHRSIPVANRVSLQRLTGVGHRMSLPGRHLGLEDDRPDPARLASN